MPAPLCSLLSSPVKRECFVAASLGILHSRSQTQKLRDGDRDGHIRQFCNRFLGLHHKPALPGWNPPVYGASILGSVLGALPGSHTQTFQPPRFTEEETNTTEKKRGFLVKRVTCGRVPALCRALCPQSHAFSLSALQAPLRKALFISVISLSQMRTLRAER